MTRDWRHAGGVGRLWGLLSSAVRLTVLRALAAIGDALMSESLTMLSEEISVSPLGDDLPNLVVHDFNVMTPSKSDPICVVNNDGLQGPRVI